MLRGIVLCCEDEGRTMSKQVVKGNAGEAGRAIWSAPTIRSVIPLSHTRGGTDDPDDQDTTFYVILS